MVRRLFCLPAVTAGFFCPLVTRWLLFSSSLDLGYPCQLSVDVYCYAVAMNKPSRRLLSRTQCQSLLAVLLWFCANAQAVEHRPFGIGVGAYLPLLTEEPAVSDPSEAPTSLDALDEQIQTRIRELGAYHPGAAELWLGAAEQALRRGDYTKADQWFSAALHNTRVNEGLNSRGQMTILEKLISVARHAGNRNWLADRVDYRFRLLGSGQAPYTDAILAAANDWLMVKTELLVLSDFDSRSADNLYDIADKLQADICDEPLWRPEWCKAFSLRLLGLMTVIDWYVKPLVTNELGHNQFSALERYKAPWDQNASDHRLQAIDSRIASRSRRIFDHWSTHFPADDSLRLIAADWEWVNGRRAKALSTYQELYQRHPDWFARPVALPELPNLTPDQRLADDVDIYTLHCLVSTSGRAAEIVLRSETATGSAAVRQQLREVKFRPVLDGAGEPVEAPFQSTIVRFQN